jgi:hypothetical protein
MSHLSGRLGSDHPSKLHNHEINAFRGTTYESPRQATNLTMAPSLVHSGEEGVDLPPDVRRDGLSLRSQLLELHRSDDDTTSTARTEPYSLWTDALPCASSTCDSRALSPWPDFGVAWSRYDSKLSSPQQGMRLCDGCTRALNRDRETESNAEDISKPPERRSMSLPTIVKVESGILSGILASSHSTGADDNSRRRGLAHAHFAEDTRGGAAVLRRAMTNPLSIERAQHSEGTGRRSSLDQAFDLSSDSEGDLFSTSS